MQCDWQQLQHLPAVTSSRVGDIPVDDIDAVMVRVSLLGGATDSVSRQGNGSSKRSRCAWGHNQFK